MAKRPKILHTDNNLGFVAPFFVGIFCFGLALSRVGNYIDTGVGSDKEIL